MDRNIKIELKGGKLMEENSVAKSFLDNMLDGEGFQPPLNCEQSFAENFEGAVSVEWSEMEDYLEAIFYKENLEHIALFSKDGILQEYRKTLPEGFLPYNVRKELELRGEIMSRVLINKGSSVQYEVILRDKGNVRYVLLVSDLGKVLKERAM